MDATERPRNGHQKRRQRPMLACLSCRKSKIRCDRQDPCGACVRSRHKTCVFEAERRPVLRKSGIISRRAIGPESSVAEDHSDSHLGPVTPVSSVPTTHDHDYDHNDVSAQERATHVVASYDPGPSGSALPVVDANELVQRIFYLERRLGESTDRHAPAPAPSSASKPNNGRPLQPEPHVIDTYLAADIHAMSSAVVSKTRYFGQSHWMSAIVHFKSMLHLFDNQSKDAKSEAMAVINRCKALARSIKAQRSPGIINKLGTNVPSREIADKLVDGYLRTLETVYRVLHVPSFRRDYEQFWVAPESAPLSFVIQLQLVMAIGSTIYDEQFSLRKLAVQWVTEAQYWLIVPPAKGRLTLTGLQIMILLTLARETASIGGDLVWIHVGTLLRSALCMGLHRDPSRLPKMSRMDAEMRRRLWNTILELELKSAIDAGGFPAISLDCSDTRPPADVDDASLTKDDGGSSAAAEYVAGESSDTAFTDMSMALALRASFRDRLAIYQMLNAIPFRGTYEDTLRLHGRFITAFKALTSRLKAYISSPSASRRQPTSFQCRFVEAVMRRCILGLHLPYLGPGLKDPAYSFSRKQVVEAAVKIYQLLFPTGSISSRRPLMPGADGSDELEVVTSEGDDLARFVICAAGFWRLLSSQPAMIITLEIQTALLEDEGFGLDGRPSPPRTDLLDILRHSLPYYLARIKAGETNVKGYLFASALAIYVHALMEGLSGPRVTEAVLTAALRTEKTCFNILKQLAAAASIECMGEGERVGSDGDGGEGDDPFDWDTLMVGNEEWGDNAENANLVRSFFDVSSVECFIGENGTFDFMSPF